MPRALKLSRLTVYLLPLVFVVSSWFMGAGFPYYLDNNETFLHYVAARNLDLWDPWQYAWMTAEGTDPNLSAPSKFYTHNPNGPRYLQYLLIRVGLSDLPSQLLVFSVLATGLTVALLWRAFAHPLLYVVALAVVLDYAGFLAWTVNTYRIWTFTLFFGLVLAIQHRRPVWFGFLIFLVFQLDYGVASFVAGASAALAVFMLRWQARPILIAAAIGVALSICLFGVQVLAFYGWDGFFNELAVTYARRGTSGETGGLGRYLFQGWHGPFLLLASVIRDTHNAAVFVVVVWGVISSAFALRRPDLSVQHRFLAHLVLAGVAGAVASSTLLYGYFVEGFVDSVLPLATLIIAPSVGIAALDLHKVLQRRWTSPHLAALCAGIALVPVVSASIMHFRPPVAVDLFQLLQTEYRGRNIVAPNLGPALAGPELAFALTGGRAFRTSDIDATSADIERFQSVRDADGRLTYVCLDTMYIRQIDRPGAFSVCTVAADRMVARGHTVVADGLGWVIVRLNADEPTLAQKQPAEASAP